MVCDAVGTQVLGDLPVPHRQRAELGRDQQDRQADGLKRRHAAIGLAQHLREDHRLGLRDVLPERHGSRNSACSASSVRRARQLLVKIIVPARVQIQWNKSRFHGDGPLTDILSDRRHGSRSQIQRPNSRVHTMERHRHAARSARRARTGHRVEVKHPEMAHHHERGSRSGCTAPSPRRT